MDGQGRSRASQEKETGSEWCYYPSHVPLNAQSVQVLADPVRVLGNHQTPRRGGEIATYNYRHGDPTPGEGQGGSATGRKRKDSGRLCGE